MSSSSVGGCFLPGWTVTTRACYKAAGDPERRRAVLGVLASAGARMGKRLYVGNLPYQCDEAQLRALFEQDGRQVEEVKIVTDRETGRPRGFAFVELATDAQAQAAVSALNGKPFGGRPLTVSEARERAPGGGGGGGGRGMGRRER